ncbi:acetyltransferase [Nitratifractor sp.]
MEKTIAVYGHSGHGKVVAQIAESLGYGPILWIDDDPEKNAMGWDEFLREFPGVEVALGIGDNALRHRIFEKVKAEGVALATLVDPAAAVARSALLGEGSVVMPQAVVNTDASVGCGCIINSASVIEHDCRLGDFVHVSPQAALAGNVRIRDRVHIGLGACVIQGLDIGEDAVVGAGAVVIENVEARTMVAGVPARKKKEWM